MPRSAPRQNPDKLRELIELWWAEAGRNGVLPLDDRRAELWRPTSGWSDPRNRTRYVYRPPVEEIRMSTAPALGNRTFSVTAAITREHAEQEGCIFVFGDHRSGITLYVHKNRLVFDYNLYGEHLKAISDKLVPVGNATVGVLVERIGRVGRASVVVGGEPCGSVDIPFLVRRHSGGNLCIGHDDGEGVSDDYEGAFPFQGKIKEVVFDLPKEKSRDAQASKQAEADIALARQ